MSTDKESSAAGTDNHPPMLVESDYESWKIRIERYIRGDAAVQVTRDKRDEEFTEIENNKERDDIQATNILISRLQGHVRKSLSNNKRKNCLMSTERFRAIGNESIHDYFVRFHKLINDMKITQLDIPTHQMNTKFVNNLPPYWAKYVTNVKNNKDILATTYVELYTYLKSYEPHAMKTLKKQEQSTNIVDPLAYLAQTTHYHAPTQTTTPPPPQYGTTNFLTPQQVLNQAMMLCWNNEHKSVSRKQRTRQDDENVGKKVLCTTDVERGNMKGTVLDDEAEAVLDNVNVQLAYDQPWGTITTAKCSKFIGYVPKELATHEKVTHLNPMTPFVNLSQESNFHCLQCLNSWIPAFAHVINQRTDPCRYPSGSGEFKPVKAMFTEQIIPFYENVKQLVQKLDENIVTEVTEYMRIFDELDTEYERCVLANKNLKIERKNLLIQNDCLIANSLEKDICSIVLASDIVVPPSSNCLCGELRSNCDREQSKVIGTEDDIFKDSNKCLMDSEKRCAFIEKNHLRYAALETELTQLKDALTSVRIQINRYKAENVNLKRPYEELSKSNTYSRSIFTAKINALTAENAKLKTKSFGHIVADSITERLKRATTYVLRQIDFSLLSRYATEKELAYHKELSGEPQPPFSTLEPKIKRGNPWSLKIPYVIGTVYTGHAYIDLQYPVNIMSRAYCNKIREKSFQARRNLYQPYKFCNFVGRAKYVHIFIGCFVYVVDFKILEDLGNIIDSGLSEVVLGQNFAYTSKLTYYESLGLIRFAQRDDEVMFRMPQRPKEVDLVSSLGKDKFEEFFV
ncbi:hypothetical protein Tco_1220368 [Tanacetum coccineum]